VKGQQLGRTIGYPTANISVQEDYKLIPQNGVYAVQSTIQGKTVFGMMNIGNRPTVNGTSQTIEVHFLDFNQDLYNQTIRVSLLKRLRSEQKFPSLDALKTQLLQDKNDTATFVASLR